MVLTDKNIKNAIKNKKMYIIPFNAQNLTGIGYNLTPSSFVFSTHKGIAEKIYNKNGKRYIKVDPYDTILIMSKENLWLDASIAGTIHSRVRIVSQGFGHISTTIDPLWRGPLLIALNNPSSQTKKFILETTTSSGAKSHTFCTIIFHELKDKTTILHDNPPQRIDILKEYIAQPPKFFGFKKKYKEFTELVEKIYETLPDNYIQKTNDPKICWLINLTEKYLELQKAFIQRKFSRHYSNELNIINEQEAEMPLFNHTFENIKDSLSILNRYDAKTRQTKHERGKIIDAYNLIIYHLKLEAKEREYIKYLDNIEKQVPKMQPWFIRAKFILLKLGWIVLGILALILIILPQPIIIIGEKLGFEQNMLNRMTDISGIISAIMACFVYSNSKNK